MRKLHFLRGDDWEAIYLDGVKLCEGHSHNLRYFLEDFGEELGLKLEITNAEMPEDMVETPERILKDGTYVY